jgi:hypothetical protein
VAAVAARRVSVERQLVARCPVPRWIVTVGRAFRQMIFTGSLSNEFLPGDHEEVVWRNPTHARQPGDVHSSR